MKEAVDNPYLHREKRAKFMLDPAIPSPWKRVNRHLLLKFSLPDTGCLTYNKISQSRKNRKNSQ